MILTRLKQRTLWHHQRLEKKLDLFHSVKTLGDYQRLLGKFLGFYEPVETMLEVTLNWSVIKFDFQPRKKTPLLMRDLNSLGVADALFLPRCKRTPMLNTLPRALGCLYVLESATLRGQIIIRHLSRTLGITQEDGGAFFNSYGNHVVAMWRDFGLQLKTYASKPETQEAVLRAAVDTFMCMNKWMTGRSVGVVQLQQVEELLGNEKAAEIQWKSILRLL